MLIAEARGPREQQPGRRDRPRCDCPQTGGSDDSAEGDENAEGDEPPRKRAKSPATIAPKPFHIGGSGESKYRPGKGGGGSGAKAPAWLGDMIVEWDKADAKARTDREQAEKQERADQREHDKQLLKMILDAK